LTLLGLVFAGALFAPVLAPNPPGQRFPDLLYAPPTRIHLFDDHGTAPHIHPLRLLSRIERRFEEDRARPVALRWFSSGVLVTADADRDAPLLLLGADGYGRDLFARLLHGARVTLALALVATLAAVMLGACIGATAGYAGGWLDDLLSRTSEFLLVLPAIYVVLALRAALPLVLPAAAVFALLAGIFALLGWPVVARGVRAIVSSERQREYAMAARAIGAGPSRLVLRHLLPAAHGHVAAQATLLLPAFILAEATMSYVGLGFPDTTPSWGTLLQEASQSALLGEAPWALAPAVAIFVVVLAVNLATGRARGGGGGGGRH
jgi:peptide/nickel transport system permease protein